MGLSDSLLRRSRRAGIRALNCLARGLGRFSLGVLAATVMLVCALGSLVVAVSQPGAASKDLGGNRPINASATNVESTATNNSPSLARNPLNPANVVVANRVDAPSYTCSFHVSFDGGISWTEVPIPFPAAEQLPPRCYIPNVSFGPKGILYLSFVTLTGLGNSPHAVWLTTSTNEGRTLGVPTRVSGPLAFGVRLLADPIVPGTLYMTWLQASTTGTLLFPNVGNPIVFTRSTDGGKTWSSPVQVNAHGLSRVVAPAIAVGPKGRLYISYLSLGDDALDYNGGAQGMGGPPYPGPWSLMLARSTNGGGQWAQTAVDAHLVAYTRFVVFLPPVPSLVVDPRSGRIYVGFTDARLGEPDVYVWSSSAGPVKFGRAVRVDHTQAGDGTAKYMPALAVAPNGRLDVLYYSRQADPKDIQNEAMLASSYDGGVTFGPSIVASDQPFSSLVAPNSSAHLPDLGSGLALLSANHGALAVWTDTRAGTVLTGKQDLAEELVSISTGSGWRVPVLVLGLILAVAGAVSLGGAAIRSRLRTARARRPSAARDESLQV